MSSKLFCPFKDFSEVMIIKNSLLIIYACRNADLNLILLVATTNRFIFSIIKLLVDSLLNDIKGVCLNWQDCNKFTCREVL